jgi:hypothetical protein
MVKTVERWMGTSFYMMFTCAVGRCLSPRPVQGQDRSKKFEARLVRVLRSAVDRASGVIHFTSVGGGSRLLQVASRVVLLAVISHRPLNRPLNRSRITVISTSRTEHGTHSKKCRYVNPWTRLCALRMHATVSPLCRLGERISMPACLVGQR